VFVDQPASLDQSLTDLRTYLSVNDDFRPGFDRNIVTLASNGYCHAQDGALALVLDPRLEWLYSEPSPDLITGDTLIWNFTSLQSGEIFRTQTAVRLPAMTALGDTVCLTSIVAPTDAVPENNQFTAKEIVIGSFDPNDITAWPSGKCDEKAILPDDRLIYRIRFQNTGTASAINVSILDTLSFGLDLSTLQLLSYSHPMGVERLDSNTIAFVFDNINLPDSTSDEAGSHGYVLYEIKQKPNLSDAFRLDNRAAIYFDYNEPVITNTESRTVVATLPECPEISGTDLVNDISLPFEVTPNPLPAGTPLLVYLPEEANLEIWTTDGKLFYRITSVGNCQIQPAYLPYGSFFVRVAYGHARASRLIVRE
jgi:uncharacterized repeat protein (TIGR01451 family)